LKHYLAKYDVVLTLEPAIPSAEEELTQRLTQAHEAAHPTQAGADPQTP
jgi:hypothetical protein